MKKINLKKFLFCPLPDNQKPINEYVEMKGNIFNKILEEKTEKYFFILSIFFTWNFFSANIFEWFIKTSLLNSIFIGIYLTLNLFRWKNLNKRFQSSKLFYEESSWFDGQIWEKPFFIIKNDKLICTQKIKPIIQEFYYKIQTQILIICCIFILLLIFC